MATWKQQAFIEEYLQCFNATEAAKRAGYSEKTAYSIGSRLLKNVEISNEIEQRLDERAMQANEIIDRLTSHARSDMGNFIDISGVSYSLDLQKAKELGLTHLIKKVKDRVVMTANKDGEETETHQIEIELYDAHAALVDLGKIRGLFVDRQDVTTAGESLNKGIDERQQQYNRAIGAIADAIRDGLHRENGGAGGPMVSGKQAPGASPANEGG